MKKYAPIRPKVAAAQAMAGAPSYVRQGSIEVRLARSLKEIKAAQKLRFKIFYEEMHAKPDWRMRLTRRDIDPYDISVITCWCWITTGPGVSASLAHTACCARKWHRGMTAFTHQANMIWRR